MLEVNLVLKPKQELCKRSNIIFSVAICMHPIGSLCISCRLNFAGHNYGLSLIHFNIFTRI